MFGLIFGVISTIWDVFTGAAAASLAVLWGIVTAIGTTLSALGLTLWKVIGQVWGFLRPAWDAVVKPLIEDVGKAVWGTLKSLYTDILKPAWLKFNKLVDRLHGWLQRKFQPTLDWLHAARTYVKGIYDKVVRPILDILDVGKQAMNLLAQLGVGWARKVEQFLSELEQRIEAPFQFVLSKLNELINWVNQIIDLDGLFQRLTLLRSLVRDVEGQLRILHNTRLRELSPAEIKTIHDNQHGKKRTDATADVRDYFEDGSGADAAAIDEMTVIWRTYFESAVS